MSLTSLVGWCGRSIFVHRYRDIFAEIRAECVTSLGEWVVAYPIKFLNDKTLKYAGWMLSDRVRHSQAPPPASHEPFPSLL